MDTLNDFSKGMQSDVSKLIQARNTYLEAINFRPFTELGGSNTSLVTIKGNSCGVKFPTMRDIYKIKLNIRRQTIFTDTIDIDITGTWGTDSINSFVVNSSTTIDTLYNAIIALPNYGTEYTAAYKDDYIMIYQCTTTVDCVDDVNDFSVSITENMVPGTQNTIWFIESDGSFAPNAPGGDGTPYIAAPVDPLIPIGYTTILEDIYLFVAVDNPAYTDMYSTGVGVPANDDYSEPGYIFRLQYDETSNITTLTLVYGAYINLTKYASIPPSATIGRYESDQIQRIYWSDFYNKVKTLNVTDPMVMATNPLLTGLQPSVHFDIPIMTNIITGSLNVGTYELCYRLKQTLGAITNYSPISNMVHLANGNINDQLTYEGSIPGTNSNKGIRFKISNLDSAFDRVEFIVLFRDSDTDVPKVYSLNEVNIPTNGIVSVDVTTLSTADEILLSDFLAIQSSFTHAKTVDTKDNRLFWGNVKVKTAALAAWDSRAFRAVGNSNPTWNDIILTNNGISSTNTLAYWTNTTNNPETNDCINEYYDSSGNFSANACYFKPGTAILGGAGSNISYEFGTYSTELNLKIGTSNSDDSANIYNSVPFRMASTSTSNIVLLNPSTDSSNQIYVQDSLYNLKSPYRSTILRGYMYEEIYRFGIQFFDLEGTPYFTKWIADIKFPSYYDPNPNPDAAAIAAGISDFRMSYVNGDQTFGQTMYIKFDVDVSTLTEVISGYKIVRLERDGSNKTILGCGLLSSTYVTNDAHYSQTEAYLPACFWAESEIFPLHPARNIPFHPYPEQESCEQIYTDSSSPNIHVNSKKIKTWDCFDANLAGGFSYSSGDKMFIRSRLRARNYRSYYTSAYQGYITAPGSGVLNDWLDNDYVTGVSAVNYPSYISPGFEALPGCGGTLKYQTGYDTDEQPYYIHMYYDQDALTLGGDFNTVNNNNYSKPIDSAGFVFGNETIALSGINFNNWGRSFRNQAGIPTTAPAVYDTYKPAYGSRTIGLGFTGGNEYYDDDVLYGCDKTKNDKLLGFYYRPNNAQYGGNTYSARAGNTYISAGSYIPIRRDGLVLPNNPNISINVLGGDNYLSYWDHNKCQKTSEGPPYMYYSHAPAGIGSAPGNPLFNTSMANYQVSVTYFFPTLATANIEMRYGDHVNTQLTINTYNVEDEDFYPTYHSNESNIVKYFSKPLDFVETNKWINRVYYSEVKYNNETKDSWQVYKTNNFYDVEGNYGAINALVAFRENLYYIQERGFGILYVNPMTAVTSDNNVPVVLGLGATIQRHNYLKLDVGTMHQWSVFRSPDNIAFIDSRHKCLYMFNGQSLEPVSDIKGQRNFFVKRFHPEIILRDNPIINKGVHTTYDYYHKEFLITFNNASNSGDQEFYNENYTLVYSEPIDAFSSLYTCTPKTYFNNNRYILSFDNSKNINGIYVHNVGYYGTFYDTETPSSIKVLVNEHPNYTKVFDNISFATESVDDQVEWIDEIITPTSNSQTYSDNINKLTDTFNAIRCYNEYQNSDWVTLTNNTNVKKREQSWHVAVPRNAVQYDTLVPSTSTIFDPLVLTKTTGFRERLRDKYLVVDLRYDNTNSYRFIVHNLKTTYRMSAR